MNNEEAIWVLKSTSVNLGRKAGRTAYAEALEMAITALENAKNDNLTPESAQNVQKQALKMQKSDALVAKTGETCSDTISRQAAIDKAKELFDMGDCYCDKYSIVGMINNLPSVQPEVAKDTNVHSNDCIIRQAAIDAIKNADVCMAWNGEISAEDAADIAVRATKLSVVDSIEALPSVQPEPLSDAYMKAVWTWLLDYQIKVAELKGRYTPYEVLSWVANDWRKEHDGSDR